MTKRRNPKVQCCTATVIAKLRVQFDFCCRKTDKRNAPREAVLSRLEDRTTYVYVGGHDVEVSEFLMKYRVTDDRQSGSEH